MRLAYSGLSDWFDGKTTLVASSPVLAAAAGTEFAKFQLARGAESWERPPVYTFESWLASLWQELRYTDPGTPVLLLPAQEISLWQQIIEECTPHLFDPGETARLARHAARLLALWQIAPSGEHWKEHEDAQQFLLWHKRLSDICRERHWVTISDVIQLLPRMVVDGRFGELHAVLFGFNHTGPTLDTFNIVTEPRPRGSGLAHAFLKLCDSFEEEIETAARYARAAWEENSACSIGVFVPDLDDYHALVERIFQDVFYPRSALRFAAGPQLASAERSSDDSIFHINASVRLRDCPLIASALLLLDLARPRIHHANATAILRCSFISGAARERSERALADLSLRRRREFDVSLWDMEQASRKCPLLVQTFLKVRNIVRTKPPVQELSAWRDFIGDLLKATGWPGEAELTPDEQEVLESWSDALSSLGSLGMVAPQVSFETAIKHLRRILSSKGVERGNWFSPVQILDSANASGLKFDSTIVVGLSDERWPPPIPVSPLIPVKLQRVHQISGSSPQSLQAERERLTHALFATSDMPFATFSGRLSPLCEPFVDRKAALPPLWSRELPVQSVKPVSTEEIEDTIAPRFDVSKGVQGGTSIIKLQSACPFRAFAEIRLRAQAPEDACFGFDARDRGGFLHRALEYVWQELKTQRRLKNIPEADLRDLVSRAVVRTLENESDSGFHSRTTRVEQERLQDLILDWLQTIEKNRLRSFTVETVEDEFVYNLAGLPLRLRVDRMDRLDDGSLLLIDYKSGPQTKNQLDCPRPREPQLLVYAAAKAAEVSGVLFGQVQARNVRLVGRTCGKHMKGTSIASLSDHEWTALANESRVEVERLASDFLAGDAAVNPTRSACEYCGTKPFCRVNERIVSEEECE
jgi:ATP-dependent helicase/nuclease subunit B